MTKEIKNYLKKLEKNNKINYFSFWKFYLKPKAILNDKENNNSNILIENEEFFTFLNLCLKDKEFIAKLDEASMKKIRYILFDRKEYLENSILDELYKTNFKENTLSKSYFNNLVLTLNSKRNNLSIIDNLIKKITFLEEQYCEKNILPELEKKKIFKKITEDDYQNISNCYLFARHGKDRKSLQYIVCDNDFLDIIQKYLLNYDLPKVIINNIIEILETGINLKMRNTTHYNLWNSYQLPEEEKIKNFKATTAAKLIDSLKQKKRTKQKIIYIK